MLFFYRDTFGQVQSLKDQKVGVGSVAVIKDGKRFIYYLITKKSSYEKPTYQSLHSSLEAMKDHMVSTFYNLFLRFNYVFWITF